MHWGSLTKKQEFSKLLFPSSEPGVMMQYSMMTPYMLPCILMQGPHSYQLGVRLIYVLIHGAYDLGLGAYNIPKAELSKAGVGSHMFCQGERCGAGNHNTAVFRKLTCQLSVDIMPPLVPIRGDRPMDPGLNRNAASISFR